MLKNNLINYKKKMLSIKTQVNKILLIKIIQIILFNKLLIKLKRNKINHIRIVKFYNIKLLSNLILSWGIFY